MTASNHDEHQQMVQDCENRESKLTDWERTFVDSVGKQLANGHRLTDKQADGLSMIYSFYEPDHAHRSGLGNFIILDHIRRAEQMQLPFVYLGYWVENAARMQYKTRYRPLEKLTPDGWVDFDSGEQGNLFG